MLKTYIKILEELDWPNIYLVSPQQFEHAEGDKIKGNYGIASDYQPIVTIARGLRGRKLSNTIYHEIGHHLFKFRPHWWIECFAEKMAGGGGRGDYSVKFGHTIDELPARSALLKIAQRASRRFNEHSGHRGLVGKSGT